MEGLLSQGENNESFEPAVFGVPEKTQVDILNRQLYVVIWSSGQKSGLDT